MKLPQLSLRELFLLVALAAMGCGWWVALAGHWDKFEQPEALLTQSTRACPAVE
jgi:hypothetical protein